MLLIVNKNVICVYLITRMWFSSIPDRLSFVMT